MADYRRYPRPRPSTRALTAKIAVLATIAAIVIGGLIAAEMAVGNDPSLGPKAAARAKKASAQPSGNESSSDDGYLGYGSDGYSGSGGYSYSPPPVTSSTS